MLTVGGFFLGLLFLAIGFFMVWKGSRLRQWVGDIATILEVSWLDWPIIGVVLMLLGAMLMTGTLQSLLLLVLGNLGNSVG